METASPKVDEYQPKVRLQAVHDQTPEVLVAAETVHQQDRRSITHNGDVVSGADIHHTSLGLARFTKKGPLEAALLWGFLWCQGCLE